MYTYKYVYICIYSICLQDLYRPRARPAKHHVELRLTRPPRVATVLGPGVQGEAVCIHINMYIYAYMYIYKQNIYIYIYIHIHRYIYIHIYIYIYVYGRRMWQRCWDQECKVRVCICIHIYIYICIYVIYKQNLNRARARLAEHHVELWPLQDIRSFIRGFCTNQYYFEHYTPHASPPFVVCNRYCPVYGSHPAPLYCHSTYHIGNSNIV